MSVFLLGVGVGIGCAAIFSAVLDWRDGRAYDDRRRKADAAYLRAIGRGADGDAPGRTRTEP